MYVCKKRTRKVLMLDTALSISKVQTIGGNKEVEVEIREEILRSKKRRSKYSKYD